MLLEIVTKSEMSWRAKCRRANTDQKKGVRGYVLPPFSPRMNYPETCTYLRGSDKLYLWEYQRGEGKGEKSYRKWARELNRYLTKEDLSWANSISLVMRKMQIKIINKYH